MTDQTTFICQNCETEFPADLTACPTCGEPNPNLIDIPDDEEDLDELLTETLAHRPWWRSRLGCVSTLLVFLLIVGSVALGVYDGLKERTALREQQVTELYRQAVQYSENQQTELAIAELNQLLTLDPAHPQARKLLAELRAQPTATAPPVSEPRQNMAADLFEQAKALTLQGDWQQAIELLKQVRDINPTYLPGEVSAALYNANFELGLRLETEGDLQGALHAFDEALVERPNDAAVTAEWEKVSLYLSLDNTDRTDYESSLVVLNRLYAIDPNFADVSDRLFNTYRNYGDALAAQNEWCLAQARYESALELHADAALETLANDAAFRCKNSERAKQSTVAPTPRAATVTGTATAVATATISQTDAITGTGTLYFSRFNTADNLWEIIAYNLSNGTEKVVLTNGTQPAVLEKTLVYHSLVSTSEGLHSFNLSTGADVRVTTFAEDVLPRWGSNPLEFVFASQRSGDRRWRIYTTFADGKSAAQERGDGRTPTLSLTDNAIIYQGTDPQGNKPGLYRMPLGGGAPVRFTTDGSDRSPAVSNTGNIAFMTTRNGNWDIFVWNSATEKATPLVSTVANEGLPVWSPNGTQLAFVSDAGGSWNIYILDTTTENASPQKITNWGTHHPDWLLQQISWAQ